VMVSSEYVQLQLTPESSSGTTSAKANVLDASAPPEANSEFQKADALLTNGSVREAIEHLKKAISAYPGYLQAHLKLGTAYMDLSDWTKAETSLKRALEIDPRTVNALFALGEVYLRQKKYVEAEKVLVEGLGIEARSAQAHLTLARVYWDKLAGVRDEAQWRASLEKSYEEVNKALRLDPNLAGAHLLKGNLYFKVRRAQDALREFEEYLRLDPKGQFAEQTRSLADKIRKALTDQKKPYPSQPSVEGERRQANLLANC
jgi:tetratricopeptide (TPR) repeat protein